uniref:Uncharacterized protein n=1 Tax=Arundo donax TaxID=35708 RepID=A0A0A9AJ23_ARUDO
MLCHPLSLSLSLSLHAHMVERYFRLFSTLDLDEIFSKFKDPNVHFESLETWMTPPDKLRAR